MSTAMVMKAINNNDATRILYAAQVVYAAANKPKTSKKGPKMAKNQPLFPPHCSPNPKLINKLLASKTLEKHTPTP